MIATIYPQMLCSYLVFIQWLQSHLLPCPFKYVTGFDCPGCGFQRSVMALVQGNLHQSLALYPPAIPLMLFFAYGIADRRFGLDTKNSLIKKSGFMLLGTFILACYGVKLYGLYYHNAPA